MTRPRRDTAKASPPPQAARRQGHLDAVLTSYDHHQHQPPTGLSSPQSTIVSGLLPPINIPGKSTENNWEGGGNTATTTAEHPHDNSSNNIDDDIDRGRSLTLGSEFDLGWDMTGGGRDERGLSFSGLLTPLGDPIPEEIASTTTVVSTYTSASTEHPHPQNLHAATTTSADGIADTSASSHSHLKSTNQGDHYHPMHQQQQQQHYDQSQQQIPVHHQSLLPARSRGDSTASASQFLNELYNSNNININNRSQFQIQQQRNQGQQQQQQQQHATSSLMSHTPPTQMGSSYENSHFGKRMRAGVSSCCLCLFWGEGVDVSFL